MLDSHSRGMQRVPPNPGACKPQKQKGGKKTAISPSSVCLMACLLHTCPARQGRASHEKARCTAGTPTCHTIQVISKDSVPSMRQVHPDLRHRQYQLEDS